MLLIVRQRYATRTDREKSAQKLLQLAALHPLMCRSTADQPPACLGHTIGITVQSGAWSGNDFVAFCLISQV